MEQDLIEIVRQAFIDGYEAGHNDTVESQYGDSSELFYDWYDENDLTTDPK